MLRTQIYLSEAERQGLQALALRSGRSQSALIREAIDAYKLAADTKVVEAKRADVAKALAEVDAAKKAQVDGQKAIETSTKEIADKEKSMADIKGELAKLEPTLQPLRDKVKQLTEQYLAMLPKAQK
jgi:predicted DNA-binding protein